MSVDMRLTLNPRTRRLLDIQGFEEVDTQDLAPVAPWLRLTFGLCGVLGGIGTLMASPTILLALALIATLAAASPVHPFDLVYNYGIRHLTGTGPLPRRGAPTRFGCGRGAVMVLVTAWAFSVVRLASRARQQPERRHVLGRLPAPLRRPWRLVRGRWPHQGGLPSRLGRGTDRDGRESLCRAIEAET